MNDHPDPATDLGAAASEPTITVFPARRVRTMEPSRPLAEAVAVRHGRILEVGTLESMRPWLDRFDHRIDDRFAERVLLPGFIDPHLHPSMAAVLLPMHFTTALPWDLPWERIEAIRSQAEFLDRVAELSARLDPDEPLFTWGHHPIWHGAIDREQLNTISTSRPIIVWHRGYHSLIVNDACLRWMGLDLDAAGRHPQIDLDRGAFFENGLSVAYRHFNSHLLDPERFRHGLDRMRQVIHQGGQTTIGDAAIGMYGLENEWDHLEAVMEQPDTPFRILLMPFAAGLADGTAAGESVVARLAELRNRNTHRLFFSDHVKMLADGGFFAELMMLDEPGYLDGHTGEWLTPPETFEALARPLWEAGLRIHVHTTGDLGVELALSTLEKLQAERPRSDHRFTFEHFGISQVARMAAQGALASVNVYYVHELARAFADHTMGYERASQMSRVGSLERAGIPFALHSDFTMAPAEPLNNAWIAANRLCESGEVMGVDERASLDAAMRAITSNAAFVLGLEAEVGTLRAGKKADLVALDDDPYDVGIEGLRDVGIGATVFEGEVFEL